MGSRTWVKVYCEKWLRGSIREESPELRGIWVDLLTLAGSGPFGDSGEIKLAQGVGLTDAQIAQILSIPDSLWLQTKQRLLDSGRISISQDAVIVITNWHRYQSEYQRQKPYRQAAEAPPEPQEKEKRKRKEKENPEDQDVGSKKDVRKIEKEIEIEKESEKLQPTPVTKSDNAKLQNRRSDGSVLNSSRGASPPCDPPKDGNALSNLERQVLFYLRMMGTPVKPQQILANTPSAKHIEQVYFALMGLELAKLVQHGNNGDTYQVNDAEFNARFREESVQRD